jgi:hypothetical protein
MIVHLLSSGEFKFDNFDFHVFVILLAILRKYGVDLQTEIIMTDYFLFKILNKFQQPRNKYKGSTGCI